MLEFDTTALLASLTKAHEDAVKRMEQMVSGFAYEFSVRAVERTPLGDAKTYWEWYKARTYLPKEEGIARGNWQFSTNGSISLQLRSGQETGVAAANEVLSSSQESYTLGSTFYITNIGPYIDRLENNYSGQTKGMGIMQPTLDDITGAYSVDFQMHYNK